ncbi:MAG: Ig domain-containing protein [Clostridia bacterium]|nr:Ig domain-containing protein [Clostridia bacterium]
MNTKNLCEEEITLAPQTEIFEEAKRIAAESAGDATDSFVMKYDANQKDFLIAVLADLGCTVTEDKDETNTMTATMNMEQLRFLKTLDCIEGVKENRALPMNHENETVSTMSMAKTATAQPMAQMSEAEAVATASVTPMTLSAGEESTVATTCVEGSDCTTSNSKENAIPLTLKALVDGCICCPGAAVWYKYTVPSGKSGVYTVYTTGKLDTYGFLFDANDEYLGGNDDANGRLNFRISATLEENQTYYICAKGYGNDTGAFKICITDNILVDSVTVTPATATLRIINGNPETLELSATISPSNAKEHRVYWDSFNKNVAEVDFNTGKVTPIGAGTAIIYAYDWYDLGRRGQCAVTVEVIDTTVYVTDITINFDHSTLYLDDEFPIDTTVYPFNAENKEVIWVSSNPNVATVNNGVVKALSEGNAIITATAEGSQSGIVVSDSRMVTVLDDNREKVTVKRDGDFNKIYFESSGKTWYCVNCDMINDNLGNQTLWDRMVNNIFEGGYLNKDLQVYGPLKTYSDDELKLLFIMDPYGMARYIQEYASRKYTEIEDIVEYKDQIFVMLFNKQPRFFSRTNNGQWYEPASKPSVEQYLSESELLFGAHTLWDGAMAFEIISVLLDIMSSALLFPALAGVPYTKATRTVVNFFGLVFSVGEDEIESDFSNYISNFVAGNAATSNESEQISVNQHKINNYSLTWSYDLFHSSNSLGELADFIGNKPHFYNEIFDFCANNSKYRIYIQLNNGDSYFIADLI